MRQPGTEGLFGLALLVSAAPGLYAQAPPQTENETPPGLHRRVVKEGLSLDLFIEPVKHDAARVPLREGDPVKVRFEMADTTSGAPVRKVRPAAWLDLRAPGEARTPELCLAKVKGLVQGDAQVGPSLDLNVYYVLTMNDDASLSVVDPLFGFGGSRLLAMIPLRAPGFDWVLTADQQRLFVSMPEAHAVAAIDTLTWTVAANIETGPGTGRLMLQPDQRYLWVASDAGAHVIDTASLRQVASIEKEGAREIAVTGDSRYAFVGSPAAGSITAVDIDTLRKVKEIPTAEGVAALAWSDKAAMLYATHRDGLIAAVDPAKLKVAARVHSSAGIGSLAFAPGGRLGFVLNPGKREVQILDTASNRIVQIADTQREPDQVAFTATLAYVRHRGSDAILMITLAQLGVPDKQVQVVDFTGGNHPPGAMAMATPAAGIIPSPDTDGVLISNAQDKAVYYYKEGMAAPMGSFTDFGRQPRALMVVDRSLVELRPGSYETATILSKPGIYDLVFYSSTPGFAHCFEVPVAVNPNLPDADANRVDVQFTTTRRTYTSGEKIRVEFRLTDRETHAAKIGAKDVSVLSYLAPGLWRKRTPASETNVPGVYAVDLAAPAPGVYYVHVASNSLRLGVAESRYLSLTVAPSERTGKQ